MFVEVAFRLHSTLAWCVTSQRITRQRDFHSLVCSLVSLCTRLNAITHGTLSDWERSPDFIRWQDWMGTAAFTDISPLDLDPLRRLIDFRSLDGLLDGATGEGVGAVDLGLSRRRAREEP